MGSSGKSGAFLRSFVAVLVGGDLDRKPRLENGPLRKLHAGLGRRSSDHHRGSREDPIA